MFSESIGSKTLISWILASATTVLTGLSLTPSCLAFDEDFPHLLEIRLWPEIVIEGLNHVMSYIEFDVPNLDGSVLSSRRWSSLRERVEIVPPTDVAIWTSISKSTVDVLSFRAKCMNTILSAFWLNTVARMPSSCRLICINSIRPVPGPGISSIWSTEYHLYIRNLDTVQFILDKNGLKPTLPTAEAWFAYSSQGGFGSQCWFYPTARTVAWTT